MAKQYKYKRRRLHKPIPEIGKRYHCFDDGKVTFSRHFIVQVDEVLGYQQFRKKYFEQFVKYMQRLKTHDYLYAHRTDKFVITHHGENDELGVYVRTKYGGWFGIGDFFNSAILDVTGELFNDIIRNIEMFDYSEEERIRLIEENTI